MRICYRETRVVTLDMCTVEEQQAPQERCQPSTQLCRGRQRGRTRCPRCGNGMQLSIPALPLLRAVLLSCPSPPQKRLCGVITGQISPPRRLGRRVYIAEAATAYKWCSGAAVISQVTSVVTSAVASAGGYLSGRQ